MTNLAALPQRGVISVTGPDRVPFLQGLVSNDVQLASAGEAVWAAFLTPQGKYLADFFIIADGDRLLLDCEAAQADTLVTKLSRYRLRSKVVVGTAPELLVFAAWDDRPDVDAIVAQDPRLPMAGWRVLAPQPLQTTASEIDWDLHRMRLGLPDGSRDLEIEKSVLLEAGFDELHGVSWSKGCYMGQELTARTKYRGLVKRRLVPVSVEGAPPSPGASIMRASQDVGTMRSVQGQLGMALLRLDAMTGPLLCGEATLTPTPPAWMQQPEPVS
jgi:tRNA-modifying protein YgfZ